MKKILALLFLFLSSNILIACQENTINTWAEIEERGYFIVGLDDTFAPMGFKDETGELIGFDIDLAKEVSKRLGVVVRFQTIDWDAKVLELNAGRIDVIWNGLTITESRLEEMAFSDPYIANTQMVLVRQDSNINKISDLSSLKVGVQISSASEEAVTSNSIYSQLDELVKYDTFNSSIIDLQNSMIDAVVIDEIMGRYIISKTNNSFVVCEENFGVEEYGIGFRLSSLDIRDKINQTLQAIIQDGKGSEISIKWFGEDIFIR